MDAVLEGQSTGVLLGRSTGGTEFDLGQQANLSSTGKTERVVPGARAAS